jgi:hypothetical protein
MGCDNPYPSPAPLVLADLCAVMAWRDDIPDDVRMALEWSADMHRAKEVEIGRVLHRNEQLEAENETYAKLLYGPNQKGGAA